MDDIILVIALVFNVVACVANVVVNVVVLGSDD